MKRYCLHALICGGTACVASGSRKVKETLEEELSTIETRGYTLFS